MTPVQGLSHESGEAVSYPAMTISDQTHIAFGHMRVGTAPWTSLIAEALLDPPSSETLEAKTRSRGVDSFSPSTEAGCRLELSLPRLRIPTPEVPEHYGVLYLQIFLFSSPPQLSPTLARAQLRCVLLQPSCSQDGPSYCLDAHIIPTPS